ncbi:Cannabinoid receptor 2 [Acropora cervicornis]|uniref:Cannabinoid receptor 2 n=1 Tax=Acropora cervicornis TaxID=6130 RepID=A0AAD9V3N0_ACRCE|nr:Cannabinoid receptor 2 [Acropora cervicornis]
MNSSVESQAVNPSTCSPFETRNERDIFSFAGQIFLIIVNILTFPAAVVLNLFVMAAVKMKRRLRQQKSNILVATLAFTDFLTGLTIQPIFIVVLITALLGKDSWLCSLETFTRPAVACVFSASLHHVLLLSGERLMAMKYTFKHTNFITTSRLLAASFMAWSLSVFIHVCIFPFYRIAFLAVSSSLITLSLTFIIFCHVTVFPHQVTQEAREQFARAKKAFNLTFTILCVLLLCYLPVFFYRIVFSRYVSQISTETKFLVDQSILLIALLNSFFNPVIYAVRIRQIRVACMELVCRRITAE